MSNAWGRERQELNFVGFAIEYKEPNGTQFYPLKNRLAFRKNDGTFNPSRTHVSRRVLQTASAIRNSCRRRCAHGASG